MKILFLDFDGVLITPRSHLACGKRGGLMIEPDTVAIAFIRKLCGLGVRIVVSSTWRKHEAKCLEWLKRHGLLEYVHTEWRTPVLDATDGGICVRSASRGTEIAAWLKLHPDISDYRIVDDDSDMLPEQQRHFLECHPYEGIGWQAMRELDKWANLKPAEIAA